MYFLKSNGVHENGNITHRATVVSIDNNSVTVEMEVEGACASCKVQAACGMTDGVGRKIAVVSTRDGGEYSVGEKVMVSVGRSAGIKAVLIAYIFPFLVLIISLLTMIGAGLNEIMAGLFSLGLMCMYFVAVLLLKKRIEKEIILKIAKI